MAKKSTNTPNPILDGENHSIQDLIDIVKRNKVLIAVIMSIALSVTTFNHYDNPKFTSRALVLSKQQGSTSFQALLGDLARVTKDYSAGYSDPFIAYQSNYLQSEAFMIRLVNKVEKSEEFLKFTKIEGVHTPNTESFIEFMHGQTQVKALRDDVISISFTASRTDSAVFFTNLVAHYAIEIIKENDVREILQAREYIAEETSNIMSELQQDRAMAVSLRSQGGKRGDWSENGVLANRISTVESELSQLRIKLNLNKDQIEKLSREEANLTSGSIMKFKGDLQYLEQKRNNYFLQGFDKASPEVVQVSEEINNASELLTNEMNSASMTSESVLNNDSIQTNSGVYYLKRQNVSLESKIKILEKTRAELAEMTGRVYNTNAVASDIDHRIELSYSLLSNLKKKLYELKVEEISISGRFGIIESAKSARAVRLMGLGTKLLSTGMASFLLGWLLSFFIEVVRPTIRHRKDLESMGLEVFGFVPLIDDPRFKGSEGSLKIVTRGGSDTAGAMAFKLLRHRILNLRLKGSTEPPKIIALVSAEPNSGKSFTALNLAVSLSHVKGNILLLDGDVRKGTISNYLGLKTHAGFAEVLSGKKAVNEAVYRDPNLRIDVMPSGKYTGHITDLMSKERLQDLFKELRKHYHHIIVDSPPVWISDAMQLAEMSDVFMLVARECQTTQRHMYEALQQLEQLKAKHSFAVLNGVRSFEQYYCYASPDNEDQLPDKVEDETDLRPGTIRRAS